MADVTSPVVLSGLRPTGRVHLGNYFGAVKNWVDLQESRKYDCFFFVADLHALTTDYADTQGLAANSHRNRNPDVPIEAFLSGKT